MKIIRLIKILTAFSWFILVLLLVAMPLPPQWPSVEQFTYADKLVHLVLFGLFCYFTFFALLKDDLKNREPALVGSFILGLGYTFFTEYIQLFIPGRTSSVYDLLSGIAGLLIFAWLGWLKTRHLNSEPLKPKLLLHICCGGCGAFVAGELAKDFQVSLFFSNPNIHPKDEFFKRLDEAKKIAERFNLEIIAEDYNHKAWRRAARGLEKEPERGRRCLICYKFRLKATANKAKELGFEYFTSTLTVSPHKDAKAILKIGADLEKKFGVKFLARDFKKQDGYKKSCQLSRELKLYRQDYCGCEFSRRK